MFEIIIQFLIGVLTPIILIGGIIAVLNELIQSFEKKEEYNRKLEELEEEIKEFSSQNQTLVEDCKSTIREIELEHQKTIQSLSRCSQSLYNEANAVLKNTHDLMIINGLLSERIQTLLKYATTSLEPEQESKLIEEITSAINHIKMENEQIAHHRQELEKAMRDIEQHDLEVAQKPGGPSRCAHAIHRPEVSDRCIVPWLQNKGFLPSAAGECAWAPPATQMAPVLCMRCCKATCQNRAP